MSNGRGVCIYCAIFGVQYMSVHKTKHKCVFIDKHGVIYEHLGFSICPFIKLGTSVFFIDKHSVIYEPFSGWPNLNVVLN